jgi:hypothetical protein
MGSLWAFLAGQAGTPAAFPTPSIRTVLDGLDLPTPLAGLPPANGSVATTVGLAAAAAQALPFLGQGLELPAGAPLAPLPVMLELSADAQILTITVGPVPLEFPLAGFRKGVAATTAAGEPTIAADPAGGDARFSARFLIRISLPAGARPILELLPDPAGDGAQIVPSKVLIGSTGFALDISQSALLSGSPVHGLAIKKATFFLPVWVPFVGAGSAEITDLALDDSGIRGPATGQLQTHAGPSTITLRVQWNRPGRRSFVDSPPTLVELSGTWNSSNLVLPGASGGAIDTTPLGGSSQYQLTARWSADVNGPGMRFAAGIEGAGSPEGLFMLEGNSLTARTLASALGLGPGVLGMAAARPGDAKTTTLAALLAAAAVAVPAVTKGRVTLYGIEVEEHVSDGVTPPKITADYTAELGFSLDGGPLGTVKTTADDPMRIRCRGVRVDLGADAGPAGVALGYDGAQIEVESPGSWQIDGPAASLLRVSQMRSGGGSIWFEVDLAVAADLGIVRVDDATLRVTFKDDGSFLPEVRGLGVSMNIPGLIDGKGFARITPAGFDAGLAASLVPLNLGASARLQLKETMIALEIGVDFPGAIPFANSGLGLYGVGGQFAINADRQLDQNETDPVQQELKWSNVRTFNGGDKTALGLAAVIGTVPDLGFSFSTRGALIIIFPDPAVVVTVSGKVLSPKLGVMDKFVPDQPGFQFLGLVAVDGTGVTFGLRGTYDLLPLVKITVPLGAYFPSQSSPQAAFVRIGTDNHPARPPGPVSVVVFPGIFNLESWAFLMVEGNGITELGLSQGLNPTLNFSGLAIGFGAGWEFRADAGPFSLSAGALLIVGIGTAPWYLAGVGKLWGELDLGPASLNVSADVKVQLSETIKRFQIRACASISLLFIDVSGCVTVTIGSDTPPPIPAPQSPLKAIHLSDRKSRVLQRGGNLPVGWPDALPILEFNSWVETALPAVSAFSALPGMQTPDRGGWVGTDELKYYFRLINLELVRQDTGAAVPGPLAAVWATPRHTPAWKTSPPPAAGARELVLLDWYPAGWARNLLDGGSGAPGNDPADYPGDVCAPAREPQRGWAVGETAFRDSSGQPVLPSGNPTSDPYVSVFQLVGPADGGDGLSFESADLGAIYFAGAAIPFAAPITVAGRQFEGAYWLPAVTFARPSDNPPRPTFELTPSTPLIDPRLILALDTRQSEGLNDGFVPTVTAQRDTGAIETWIATSIGNIDGFSFYIYRSNSSSGPWVGFGISSANFRPEAPVAVVGMQALTLTAKQTADGDAKARAAQHDQQGQVAALPPASQKPLLEPGVTYTVRATIDWQAERSDRSGGGKVGPTPLPVQEFSFQIASTGSFGEDPSRIETDESVFDFRGLRRYVSQILPLDLSNFWLRQDPMVVHYVVGHAEQMAAKYGRKIELQIRRTDPPPGQTQSGFVDWKLLDHELVHLLDLTQLPAVDQRWNAGVRALAIQADPCQAPEVGATALAPVQLEPRAHYELRLIALKTNNAADAPVEIARSVFTTSHYNGPADLLADPGFGGAAPVRELPVTVTGALPALADGDAVQEAALRALGIDPWPIARGPGLYSLWELAGQQMLLRGLLVELDEPIHRPDRLRVVAMTAGGLPLPAISRSSGGTRILGLFSAPVAPPTASIVIQFQEFAPGTNPPLAAVAPQFLTAVLSFPPRLQRDFE